MEVMQRSLVEGYRRFGKNYPLYFQVLSNQRRMIAFARRWDIYRNATSVNVYQHTTNNISEEGRPNPRREVSPKSYS